jgi:glucose/arabinose dehydrogenase
MMITARSVLFACALFLFATGCNESESDSTGQAATYRVDTVLTGLEHPWGMVFLPGANPLALVTERPGRLNLVDITRGSRTQVTGLPQIAAAGQGGLLDVALHPDFEENRLVYLSYAAAGESRGQFATHVCRGRLDAGEAALSDVEVILVAEPFVGTEAHFGSRLVFDSQKRLYVTAGDRRNRHSAQDLTSLHGKTLRIHDDGSIPADNPFIDAKDVHPAIYSYGHRNSQGMARHPETGEIWQCEHGEFGGDEINILVKGGNFGWPIATYAREYISRRTIGALPPERDDTIAPIYYWEADAFPPSGMAFYKGDAFKNWRGNLFVGGLKERCLSRFEINGRRVVKAECLLEDRGWRIRDVKVNPDDGFLYVLVDAENAPLVKIMPAKGD